MSTGFPPKTRALILARSGGRCELCGGSLYDVSGSVHHRRPRRMGGDRRPEASAASNGLAICGSGTTGCHGRFEGGDRALAYEWGIILPTAAMPAEEPVRLHIGWALLTDDGGYHLEGVSHG